MVWSVIPSVLIVFWLFIAGAWAVLLLSFIWLLGLDLVGFGCFDWFLGFDLFVRYGVLRDLDFGFGFFDVRFGAGW